MARGGIQEFTVDKICAEAGVSRGLIRHHFGSMNALLAAVYSSIYNDPARLSGARREGQSRISHLLESIFAPEVFNREVLTIWLTLWGQASLNPELSAGHRVEYSAYHNDVAKALEGLPKNKLHCSNLGADALHLAIQDYEDRKTGKKRPQACTS